MAKVSFRLNDIAHALLELLGAGKAAVALALPDKGVVDPDLEIPAASGQEGHFAQTFAEGGEQFLCHPASAEQPVALGAVENGDARFFHSF